MRTATGGSMKTSVPRREIKMYTLLSTFPLHDTPAGRQDSKLQRKKFAGHAGAARDVIAPRRLQVRKKPKDIGQA
jgi:hypothetical protein